MSDFTGSVQSEYGVFIAWLAAVFQVVFGAIIRMNTDLLRAYSLSLIAACPAISKRGKLVIAPTVTLASQNPNVIFLSLIAKI